MYVAYDIEKKKYVAHKLFKYNAKNDTEFQRIKVLMLLLHSNIVPYLDYGL